MITATNKHQMYGPSRAGQLVKGCSVHAPAADQAQGHVHSFVAGSAGFSTSRLSEFRSTGRGLRGSGIFSATGHSTTRARAKSNKSPGDSRLKNLTKGSEHSKSPSRYGPEPRARRRPKSWKPHPTRAAT